MATPGALAAASTPRPGDGLSAYLAECRELVLQEIRAMMPRPRYGGEVYDLLSEYPLRGGKALRPALCIATCRALGGYLEAVIGSAAAIELLHNAFLVHDDVEDGSELRRGESTLHREHGVAKAINSGDAGLIVSLRNLLGNTERIGVGQALEVLRIVVGMGEESVEGQSMELEWIGGSRWQLDQRLYIRMVYKKTTCYSFIAPVRIGVLASRATGDTAAWIRFATLLGVAFQIQDDVLNLVADGAEYGKEIGGDLWEGKHTLMLIHALRCASSSERDRATRVLAKSRPSSGVQPFAPEAKTADDVAFLRQLIDRYGGIDHAARVAGRHAAAAARSLDRLSKGLAASVHVDFLHDLVTYVVRRTR